MEDIKNTRIRLSLDPDWRFYLGDAVRSQGKNHGNVYDFTKAGGVGGPAKTDYNDNNWEVVNLPHDWAVYQDFSREAMTNQGYKARGIGWYRKLFKLEETDKGKQILLEFDGIATDAIIYFNGSEVYHSKGGYTSFAVDISDRIYWGNKPNTLAVRVDASVWEGWWYEGAGIYRHVWLTKKSPVHISHWGTWVNPQRMDESQWAVQIETAVENSSYQIADFSFTSRMIDMEGNLIGEVQSDSSCAGGEQAVVKQTISVQNPELWDIGSPKLYKLVGSINQNGVQVDRDETRFGFRTIKVCPDTGFYLNDRPLKIKGTCNHQDHAGIGTALPDSIHYYRIQRLKDMGSNAYRCAHGNPAKELLDACDELGMIVMDESRKFESTSEGIKQVENMVRRDRNHPSVVMYSIFNEEPLQGTPQGRAMAQRLIHVIKRLDDTRFVTAAMNGGLLEDEGVADVLDITGFNYNMADFDRFHSKHPDQPILGSENNCTYSTRGVYHTDSKKQIFSSYDDEKAYWGDTVRGTWEAVNTRNYVMGLFVWTGFDYRGEPSPYTWPSINSHWGAMDTCGFAKDGFYLHKACWSHEPMVHILPHWNWKGMEGSAIKVMSHTNCEEVELFLNGKSLGRKPSPIYEQATWDVIYEPGVLEMKGYIDKEEVTAAVVRTTDHAATISLEPFRDYIYGDGLDAIPIDVAAVDATGNFVPTDNSKIRFTIEGPGQIIGVGNGDPNSHEIDKTNERSLFNGKCQAIIQSSYGSGDLVVRAEAEGLQFAELVLRVLPKEPPKTVTSVFERYIVDWRMTQKIYSERPDPHMTISDTDMNTWERIEFNDGPQNKFNDCLGGYALYRANFTITDEDMRRFKTIKFYKVMGMIEVYLNGEKTAEVDCSWGKQLYVSIGNELRGEKTITVLIKSDNPRWPYAGICQPVVLCEDESEQTIVNKGVH